MTELIKTPCVSICGMDNGICVGCGRTTEEVSEWINYTDEQRTTIMERLEKEINELFD